MQIQINSDRNIPMHAKLSGQIEADLHRILNRYEDQLTRIEVHLTDENGDKKSGPNDKRCVLEARPRHYPSVTVTNTASDVLVAVTGAADKMFRLLGTTFGRIAERHKNETPRVVSDTI